jgi:hypothetical protein
VDADPRASKNSYEYVCFYGKYSWIMSVLSVEKNSKEKGGLM